MAPGPTVPFGHEPTRRGPVTTLTVTAPAPREVWSEVLASDDRAIPCSGPAWMDAITGGTGLRDESRLYEVADGRRFVVPLAVRRVGGVPVYAHSFSQSWGYGGAVGRDLDAPVLNAIVDDLAHLGLPALHLRPRPSDSDVWSELCTGQRATTVTGHAHVIDLSGGHEEVWGRLHKKTRSSIKKAQRQGVTIERSTGGRLLDAHYELYLRSIRRWAAQTGENERIALTRARLRDPLNKLTRMSEALGASFTTWIARYEGRDAASSIVLTGADAHDTRAAMDRDIAGPTRASYLLLWRSIEDAIERGCQRYHLGSSKAGSGLADFKERFGAEMVEVRQVRLERIPLTRLDTWLRPRIKRIAGFDDDCN